MATAANLAIGATPAREDPFVSTPSPYQHRYTTLDNDQYTSYSTNSPAQARRALEAHLKETNRRMQDAAKLGQTLVKQREIFTARLKELESVKTDDEVPDSLRQKLSILEKEYNEVGRESARAFLPKLRPSNSDATTLTGQGGSSPSKVSAPSRRQRNQPGARVHDIEFATEISTSLLAQVRQLQAALADKDNDLRNTVAGNAQLESDVADLTARVKQMDDRSQGYKDENWNLEARIQELENTLKTHSENHLRLGQTLSTTQAEKLSAQRDLDELKVVHDKALETHASDKKQQDQDIHTLRRDLATHEADKQALQKQIEELNSNNKELARAVSYRLNQPNDMSVLDDTLEHSDDDQEASMIDNVDMSPVKGTPARPGMLESETMKSSLNHAHRMIQNLKNNIHREKTEKLELKRMLSDARDELERRGGASTVAEKGRKREIKTRPVAALGAAKGAAITEVIDDPEWEDDGEPTRPRLTRADTESTDAFETADERRETTETEGFETGHEAFDDDSDELTETEGGLGRGITIRKRASQQPVHAGSGPGDRRSYMSTASTSDSEDADVAGVRTPSQTISKFKLKKSNRRSGRYSQIFHESPASNNSTPQNLTQTLGDELDGLDDTSVEGTPSKMRDVLSASATPETSRSISAAATPSHDENDVDQTVLVSSSPLASRALKPTMVDTGCMTEPWQPEARTAPAAAAIPIPAEPVDVKAEDSATPKRSFSQRVVGVAGGALAGFGLGRISKDKESSPEPSRDVERDGRPSIDTTLEAPLERSRPSTAVPSPQLSFSSIVSESYEPAAAPAEDVTPALPRKSSKRRPSVDHGAEFVAIPNMPTRDATATARANENITREYVQPKVYGGGRGANGIPTLVHGDNEPDEVVAVTPTRKPLSERSPNVPSHIASMKEDGSLPITTPLQTKKPMLDEGSQTSISSEDIEAMLRNKAAVDEAAVAGADASPNKRPGSSGSTRNRSSTPAPPLPPDSEKKIAAAAKTPLPPAAAGVMGPPIMPASAYRSKTRPMTPADRASLRSMSRDGTTPRAARTSVRDSSTPGRLSRTTSVSSFASELDVRFNINRENLMYPDDIAPATEPRMIQAITQTMIGEYLWKYTRKAGRSDTSSTRHRRFFWVHPYTRTLYWSESDPSTASKSMMRAKSVPIESVRVISDDNVNPPGLHRKSLVIVTPSREIVMTAPTSQRHETWINALSYLLLKTDAEKGEDAEQQSNDITEEDVDEFNPGGFSIRRSISRMARGRSRSRVSLSSYNSRVGTRTSSPTAGGGRGHHLRDSTLHERVTRAERSQSSAPATAAAAAGSTASRTSGKARDSSRFSSIASRFVPAAAAAGTGTRGSVASTSAAASQRADSQASDRKGDGGGVYNASAMSESAEDVRQAMAKLNGDAAEMENVRACCDGKHDVGSLSRTSKHMSLKPRMSGSHGHSHS